MLAAARVELLDPKPQKPSYRHLLHVGVGAIQHRLNRVQNTGRAWAVGEAALDVSSGTADYTLPAVGSGKVLDVVTYDASNEDREERQIPFHDLSDVADGWNEWGEGAARIAFYRKGGTGQLWARVRPVPTSSESYRVLYSVGAWAANADLGSSPLLAQFHNLFVLEIAQAGLPAAEWFADEKENRLKRAELRSYLQERIAEQSKEFDVHVASLAASRNTFRAEAFAIDG
jgi:crotonobetainyl-CoA:carnitine CoA-transferase CaiB-like acyl-CoA transferase